MLSPIRKLVFKKFKFKNIIRILRVKSCKREVLIKRFFTRGDTFVAYLVV